MIWSTEIHAAVNSEPDVTVSTVTGLSSRCYISKTSRCKKIMINNTVETTNSSMEFDGKMNPADIISKHWAYPQIWYLLKPLLFYSCGDLIEHGAEQKEKEETDS
jgi:hypothetical protein